SPPKNPPDDTSYSAPDGGILATIAIQVLAGQAGQPLLTINLDDGDPNPPGSGLSVFTSAGLKQIYLDEGSLFDGFHAEGSTCVPPVIVPPLPGTNGSPGQPDRKSTRLNSSHVSISYAVFCLKKKKKIRMMTLCIV